MRNMTFRAPPWAPRLDLDAIPDSIPISDFMLDEDFGRFSLEKARSPFICGLSGLQFSAIEVKTRVRHLARGLAEELGWHPNQGTEWDKVIAIFSHNTLDNIPLSWAVHSLSGISSPANSAYNASELAYQLRISRAKAIFTCTSLLPTAAKAAEFVGISKRRIYIIDEIGHKADGFSPFKHVSQIILRGAELPALAPLQWRKGQGTKQCAFLAFSSGTSGHPKAVVISHFNVIANVLQLVAFQSQERMKDETRVVLGLLPQSHIYGLVCICHASVYRGDAVVVLPNYELKSLANAIQSFKINVLFVVPPIVIRLLASKDVLEEYDISSIREIFCGAAPLGLETCRTLNERYPKWSLCQAYGMTETATVISATSPRDIVLGSAGCLLPGVEARLVSLEDGSDITACDKSGELWLRSPSVANLGYLNDKQATLATFGPHGDKWLRTGDVAMFVQSPRSHNVHLVIVDRIKELIKVNAHQVAPAELEAYLMDHPLVADATVISVPDANFGEVPKAFVVLAPHDRGEYFQTDEEKAEEIDQYIKERKARYKSLKGGIEFVEAIPKSPSGKILRRVLQDEDRRQRRSQGERL